MIRSGPVNYDYISLKTRFEASFPENMDGVTPKVPLHLSVCRTILRITFVLFISMIFGKAITNICLQKLKSYSRLVQCAPNVIILYTFPFTCELLCIQQSHEYLYLFSKNFQKHAAICEQLEEWGKGGGSRWCTNIVRLYLKSLLLKMIQNKPLIQHMPTFTFKIRRYVSVVL